MQAMDNNQQAKTQIKVKVRDLKPGMFVCRLDRPWIETPFMVQGILVKSEREIEAISRHCCFVYVDVRRSKDALHKLQTNNSQPIDPSTGKPVERRESKRIIYNTSTSLKKELTHAASVHSDLSVAVTKMFENIERHKPIDIMQTCLTIKNVVGSVVRNPDAMVWMARVKEKDAYTYEHSVRASILAAIFGRHLGLSRQSLESLTLGTLLCDVGKTKLPNDIITKTGKLSSEERKIMEQHVEIGIEILRHTPDINEHVKQIVWCHHERLNGSGYPRKLKDKEIPILAKIASIVDCYDAITSPRIHAAAMNATDAVSALYRMRGNEFAGNLVEQFIQAIGIYPTGTLVQLSNDEIGIVIAQNPARRLRPKVMVVLDENKMPIMSSKIIDLKNHEKEGGLNVAMALKAGAFGLYPEDLKIMEL